MRSALLAVVLLGFAAPAYAHFKLNAPASMTAQDAIGDPQKTGPCPNIAETGAVTTVPVGGMLAVTVDETIDHPGHYRVAIAQDAAGLPAPPIVTGLNCGSAPIQANPTMPVLADGLFTNLTSAMGEATVQVQLPAGFTCTNCVVQVLEFMSAHAEPCFYYHCARVTISDTPAAPDAGPGAGPDAPGPDAGTGGPGAVDGGCSTSGGGGLAGTALLLGLFALRRRRR